VCGKHGIARITTGQDQKGLEEESETAPRISKELVMELRNKKLASKSDFLFVEELEDVDDDIVKVNFETPFTENILSQKFSKPGYETREYPSLADLYDKVGADITEPKSILSVSIPSDLDIIDVREENLEESQWIENEVRLDEREDRSTVETIGTGAFVLAGFAGSVLVYTGSILSLILASFLLLTGISIGYVVGFRELIPPEESKPVHSPMDVSEGDTLILDKYNPIDKKDREVCRVLENFDRGMKAILPDGNTVAVNYDSSDSEWVIYDYSSEVPDVDDSYFSAYVLKN